MPRTQLNVDVEPEEKRHWKSMAESQGKTLGEWIRELLNMASNFKPKTKSK